MLTLITNPLIQQPAASSLSRTDSCVKQHILTLSHSISEIRASSLFWGHHMDCMFSAYSKYHWKVQNHSQLLCSGTAGFYAIVLMVQQETEFLQDLVKDVAAAFAGIRVCEKSSAFPIASGGLCLLFLMPHTTICTFKTTNQALLEDLIWCNEDFSLRWNREKTVTC